MTVFFSSILFPPRFFIFQFFATSPAQKTKIDWWDDLSFKLLYLRHETTGSDIDFCDWKLNIYIERLLSHWRVFKSRILTSLFSLASPMPAIISSRHVHCVHIRSISFRYDARHERRLSTRKWMKGVASQRDTKQSWFVERKFFDFTPKLYLSRNFLSQQIWINPHNLSCRCDKQEEANETIQLAREREVYQQSLIKRSVSRYDSWRTDNVYTSERWDFNSLYCDCIKSEK